jgi:small GTP-binding protein
MTNKKVCMLGTFAVGKTSLVSQFVSSVFSDKYLTTVGVKVDKKSVSVDGRELTMMLWDINGQDEFQTVQQSYLRGAAAYLLVADGTRRATLDAAIALQEKAQAVAGKVPFVLVLNKSDLAAEWQVDDRTVWKVAERGWAVLRTSAKSGVGVEDAFMKLARSLLEA